MPIIKSAKKRVKVARKATVRNSKTKRSLKTALKAFATVLSTDAKKAPKTLDKVQSELDKAAKKGVIHKNKAARKKSQAARAAHTTSVPGSTKTTKAEPAAAKKTTVAKRAPAKKSSAKK